MTAQDLAVKDPAWRTAASATQKGAASILVPLATLLGILVVWQIVSVTVVNRLLLPPPTEIVASLGMLVTKDFFWEAVGTTAYEAVVGFALGAAAGFLAGTAIGLNAHVRRAVYPLAVAFQTMPTVAFAPLFIAWFGFGTLPRVLFAAIGCAFPILVAAVVGLESVSPDARSLLRSFGAKGWTMYRKLLFPDSLPVLFAGIRTAVPMALVGALVAEFVAGNSGMGVLLMQFNFQLQVANAFAVIVTLAVFGVVSYGLVELIDRRAVSWSRHRSG